jgi:hypothetical protein
MKGGRRRKILLGIIAGIGLVTGEGGLLLLIKWIYYLIPEAVDTPFARLTLKNLTLWVGGWLAIFFLVALASAPLLEAVHLWWNRHTGDTKDVY